MKQNQNYSIDHSNRKIIVTKSFLKAAGVIGSPAYTELMKVRKENLGYDVKEREIAKRQNKISYRDLTYENMEEYIKEREKENAQIVLNEFKRVQELGKIYKTAYFSAKSWFLARYKDEFKKDEESAA